MMATLKEILKPDSLSQVSDPKMSNAVAQDHDSGVCQARA